MWFSVVCTLIDNDTRHHSGQNLLRTHSAAPRESTTHLSTSYLLTLQKNFSITQEMLSGRCGGLMVSALDSGVSTLGLSPGLGHCIVFLGKTLYSHGASFHLPL